MTMRGEKVYECDFDVTGMTDFGITLDAILSGTEKIPPQGARVDVAYAGTIRGRVSGSIRGVDYQVIRADGRPRTGEPMADLFENVCASSRLPPTTLGSTPVRPGPWAK
jgi:hypothetical protein